VQDAANFNDILVDPVDRKKGDARKHQFACVGLAAWAATARKLSERTYTFIDSKRHKAGCFRSVMFANIVANASEIAGSRFCPADPHLSAIPIVNQLSDFLVVDAFAAIGGR